MSSGFGEAQKSSGKKTPTKGKVWAVTLPPLCVTRTALCGCIRCRVLYSRSDCIIFIALPDLVPYEEAQQNPKVVLQGR